MFTNGADSTETSVENLLRKKPKQKEKVVVHTQNPYYASSMQPPDTARHPTHTQMVVFNATSIQSMHLKYSNGVLSDFACEICATACPPNKSNVNHTQNSFKIS